jgi:hypothetical protein
MAIRRNVQEQNAATREGIRSIASAFRNNMLRYPWLSGELISRKLDPSTGILVRLEDIPEQYGNLYQGYWLSAERRFYYFEILVARGPRASAQVEEWRDATDEVVVKASQPGTGMSFGFVALEVLSEWPKFMPGESGAQ